HVREEPQLSPPARRPGDIRILEWSRDAARPGYARREGLALSDAARPEPVHRYPRRAADAHARCLHLARRRPVEAEDRARVPAIRRRSVAHRTAGEAHEREGVVDPIVLRPRPLARARNFPAIPPISLIPWT